jgi:DNA repair exonuclease SbcCD nuclease subunit
VNFNKLDNELELEYILRICSQKDVIGTWAKVASILNENLNQNYDESAYRKKYQSYKTLKNIATEEKEKEINDEHIVTLREEQDKLYKQQIKTRDALREYRSGLRDEARIENLLDCIKEDTVRYNPEISYYKGNDNGINTAILCIGDWHCGDEVDNFYNKFNLTILEQRIAELGYKTIKYCKRNNVKTLNVVNLGDMIQNSIHTTCRVMNEMDAINQVKQVSRLIYNLLTVLAENIEQVTYRSVLDNHSRINMNYKEHIEKESFAKLIDWWLVEKINYHNEKYQDLIKNPILMEFDNIDDNIGYLKINGKNIFFSHGHLGSQHTITQDLTFATGIIADIVLLGHFHKDQTKNFQGKKVFFNGTLKGVDEYAMKKRLFGLPSQSLIIFDENDVFDIPMEF